MIKTNYKNELYRYGSEKRGGFVALVAILIIGAVTAAIAASLLLFGSNYARNSLTAREAAAARAAADACAEEILLLIPSSTRFPRTGSISFGQASCDYSVIDLTGQRKSVRATGRAGLAVRRVVISISRTRPMLVVDSWRETADF